MKTSKDIETRISARIQKSKSPVFFRADFADFGSPAQVGRVLRALVARRQLLRVGHGLYVRTKASIVNGKSVPEISLPEIAEAVLKRLGIKTAPTRAERAYNEGRSTQVPTGRVIGVRQRVTRRIGYGGVYIFFEVVP